ncbi:hypothetical protein WG66_011183 [Moniliophthora roreri]|nr:hypothetical protein WG66_011183 [Moniliophthora roreri]
MQSQESFQSRFQSLCQGPWNMFVRDTNLLRSHLTIASLMAVK